jgi:hypothetical protein
MYFHAKAVEAVSIILDFAFAQHARKPISFAAASVEAAKEALRILDQAYAGSPSLEALADTVGIVMSDNYKSGVTTIRNRGSTGVLGYLEPSAQRRLCGRGQASERTDEDVVGGNPFEHGRDEERDVRRYGPQVPGFGPFAHSGSSPT